MTICNSVASYLTSLTATNPICSEFGSTFTFGTNLFMYLEPDSPSSCVTIIPYGGAPVDSSGYKYESYVQMRIRSTSRQTSMNVGQALIDNLHNVEGSNYKIFAKQSTPFIFDVQDNGALVVSVSDYKIIHIRV